jgi:hypothetical protein
VDFGFKAFGKVRIQHKGKRGSCGPNVTPQVLLHISQPEVSLREPRVRPLPFSPQVIVAHDDLVAGLAKILGGLGDQPMDMEGALRRIHNLNHVETLGR